MSRVQKSSPEGSSVRSTAGSFSPPTGAPPNGSSLWPAPEDLLLRSKEFWGRKELASVDNFLHLTTANSAKWGLWFPFYRWGNSIREAQELILGHSTCQLQSELTLAAMILYCFLPRRINLTCPGFGTFLTILPTLFKIACVNQLMV